MRQVAPTFVLFAVSTALVGYKSPQPQGARIRPLSVAAFEIPAERLPLVEAAKEGLL